MNMCKVALSLVVALHLAGCGSAQNDLVGKAEDAVRHIAKDPDSVIFREVRVVQLDTGAGLAPIVCGEFNAKNGFGGYSGFEAFAWHPDGKLLAEALYPDGVEVVQKGISALCAGKMPEA